MKAILMCTERRAHDAFHTFLGGLFDGQFTASSFQSFDHRGALAAGFGGCVISKPFGQGLCISAFAAWLLFFRDQGRFPRDASDVS